MKPFTVDVLPVAEAEVREAFLWYFDRSPLAADGFRVEVVETIDALAERADLWAVDEDGIRHVVLRHFPYTVHYTLDNNIATVLAVAHQRRMPGYWKQR